MKLYALHGFKSPEGKFEAGDFIPTEKLSDDRKKFLVAGGYAKEVSEAEAKNIPSPAVANPNAISTAKPKE